MNVLLGLAPHEEEAIEETLYASGKLRVLASGADAGELCALAARSRPDLVLVSAGLPGLDGAALMRLRALAPRLAGVALDERDAAALRALDLDHVLAVPLEADRLLALAAGPVPAVPAVQQPRSAAPAPARSGSVIAVVGAKGAPGASELAASFAALVARQHDLLLAELDADGGGLAARLGLDAQEGSLLGLTRALAAGEADIATLLPYWLAGGSRGWPPLLLGFPGPSADLAEALDAAPGGRLVDVLAASFPLVVCDVGQRLRGGPGDLAARLHREVCLAADAVVVVLGTRPEQLRAGLAQLDLLAGELAIAPEALRVVVNGQPCHPPGRCAASLTAELAARGLSADAWLPFDERALRAAVRRRLPLALAAPRGGYAGALAGLVAAVLLPSLPRPAARKRRLAPRGRGQGAPALEEVALPWRP